MKHCTFKFYELILLLTLVSVFPTKAQTTRLTDWQSIASKNNIQRIAHDQNYIYVAALAGGVTKINKTTGQQESLNRGNQKCFDNTVLNMVIDNDCLWLTGRAHGLSKFKDNEVIKYYFKELEPTNGQFTQGLYIEDDNIILLGGLLTFYKFEGSICTYIYNMNPLSPMAYITDIKKKENGEIYVSGYDWNHSESFYQFKNNKLIKIDHPYGNIVRMIVDGNRLWLATEYNGLVKYENGAFTQFSTSNSNLPTNKIFDICRAEDGTLWLTGLNYIIAMRGNEFSFITLPSEYENEYANCVDADNNNIYIGTKNNGLLLFNGNEFKKVELIDNLLPDNKFIEHTNMSTSTTATTSDGTFLIVGSQGLYGYNPLIEKSVIIPNPANEYYLNDVCVSPLNDDIWLWYHPNSTYNNSYLLKINSDTLRISPPEIGITKLLDIDNKGNLWVATSQGIGYFDGKDWKCYNESDANFEINGVVCVKFDKKGRLWAGSFGCGLIMYDGYNWHNYTTRNSSIPSNCVGSLGIDNKDIVWLNCRNEQYPYHDIYGYGLTKFDGISWNTYNTSNSPIKSDNIYAIEVDSDNVKWLATCGNVGVTSFDGENWEIYNVDNSGIANNTAFNMRIDPIHDLIYFVDCFGDGGVSCAKITTSKDGIIPITLDSSMFIQGEPLELYNIHGNKIFSTSYFKELPTSITQGIYIAVTKEKVKKIIIK